ncbi:SusC/RagA family TonB-linked outer membrane protein [Rapidithrix thailandica]|uniref:SusC/RagA family TonB-linked outer membrane protein n=1 Tax=Rapidithrix thailandica TaxID=413964 RepID=A0AAW9SBS6_9BACT
MNLKLLTQIWKMTKLLFYGIVVQSFLCGMLMAEVGKSQSIKEVTLSVTLKDATLEEAFAKLERKTGFRFLYDPTQLSGQQRINTQVSRASLADLLISIAQDANLSFKRINQTIVVRDQSSAQKEDLLQEELRLEKEIKGQVTSSEDGAPLPGVTIVVKGTTIGTTTDFDGNYHINAPDDAEILVFSSIGYQTKEVTIGNQSEINIVLPIDTQQLEEVVVTALGIEREAKTLAYGAAQLGGEEMAMAREGNILNNLSGKVAGVNISQAGTGLGGSTRITIRGNSFFQGNNQPLIVIDGVPIDNQGTSTDDTYGNRQLDYGNGLSDINMDDVENISVLKGPAATALYGSRAGNGVVMITTKSGGKERFGMSFNSNTVIEMPRDYLEMQNRYGQGSEGVFDPSSGNSWGPAMDGSQVTDWTGETKAYSPNNNDIKDFLENGVSTTNTLELFANGEKSSVRGSVGHNYAEGVFPGSEIKKILASMKVSTKMTDKISSEVSFNYANTQGKNRIKLTRDPDNPYYSYVIMPRSVSYSDLKTHVRNPETLEPLRWTSNGGVILNPYYTVKYNTNEDSKDRLIGYAKFKYEFSENAYFHVRYGLDFYSLRQRDQLGTGVPYWFSSGDVRQTQTQAKESNIELLMQINKIDLVKNALSANLSLGGNFMAVNNYSQYAAANGLEVPEFYSIRNSLDRDASENRYQKRVNSAFGMVQFSFKEFLFLDVTARQDWSSTLKDDNWSYFYPSVGMSWVISDTFEGMPSWLSFAKVRASYAEVGNDPEPYGLYLTNTITNSGAIAPDTKPNPDIQPERLKSIELGMDLNLFQDRVAFEMTYYKNNAINQIIKLPVNPALEGFKYEWINAGEIENKGLELSLNAKLVQTEKFGLNLGVNWYKNTNKIISLDSEVEEYLLSDGDVLVKIWAVEGGAFGDIYGTTIKTDEQGRPILNAEGNYQESDTEVKLGNYTPDWNAGVNLGFTYGSATTGQFSFNVLFDYTKGGDIYSFTNAQAARFGTSAMTLENNREGYTIEGVDAEGNSVTSTISAQQYWTNKANIDSEWIYDKSELNLRELTLGYRFPTSLFDNLPVKGASLNIVARNLATFGSNLNGVPPYAYTTSNQQGAEAYAAPRTSTLGFNLRVQF